MLEKKLDGCDFCAEIHGSKETLFNKLYDGKISSRIVAASDNFVAIPTLGQLFTGSMLILPKVHVETSASLPIEWREELVMFVGMVMKRVSQFGAPIIFEHGATSCSGGGCGIYHAHVHIVPLPRVIDPLELLPGYEGRAGSLNDALGELHHSDTYLLIGYRDNFIYIDLEDNAQQYPSQYFRQQLAKYFSLNKPWDWREYITQENELANTIRAFS